MAAEKPEKKMDLTKNSTAEIDSDDLDASDSESERTVINMKALEEDELLASQGEEAAQHSGHTPNVEKQLNNGDLRNAPSTSKGFHGSSQMGLNVQQERDFNPEFKVNNGTRNNAYRNAVNRERSASRKVKSYLQKLENPVAKLTSWEQSDYKRALSIASDPNLKAFIQKCKKDRDEEKLRKAQLNAIVLSLGSVSMGECNNSADEENKKRKRSEDIELQNEAKKSRSPDNVDDKLSILVINLKAKDCKITPELWIDTEGEILDSLCDFYESADDTPCLEFQGVGWDRSGHKLIACADKFTVTWLMGTIDKLEKNEILDRKAIHFEELSNYVVPRGWIWIPPPVKPASTVLMLITKQNRWLNTVGWTISQKVEKDEDKQPMEKRKGYKFYLGMNKESIPALKEREFVIQYSLAKAVINLFNRSDEEKESQNPPN